MNVSGCDRIKAETFGMCHGCQCFDQSTWCLQLKMPQAGQRLDRNSTRTTSAWCLTAWPPTHKRTSTLIQPHVPTREIKREREGGRERRGSAHFNFPRHLDPAPTVPAFYTRFQERSLITIIICRYVQCKVGNRIGQKPRRKGRNR